MKVDVLCDFNIEKGFFESTMSWDSKVLLTVFKTSTKIPFVDLPPSVQAWAKGLFVEKKGSVRTHLPSTQEEEMDNEDVEDEDKADLLLHQFLFDNPSLW